jgi:hypothetical protein
MEFDAVFEAGERWYVGVSRLMIKRGRCSWTKKKSG